MTTPWCRSLLEEKGKERREKNSILLFPFVRLFRKKIKKSTSRATPAISAPWRAQFKQIPLYHTPLLRLETQQQNRINGKRSLVPLASSLFPFFHLLRFVQKKTEDFFPYPPRRASTEVLLFPSFPLFFANSRLDSLFLLFTKCTKITRKLQKRNPKTPTLCKITTIDVIGKDWIRNVCVFFVYK